MCGRFEVNYKNREIDRLLALLPPGSPPVKAGEVFPTNPSLALGLFENAAAPRSMAWGFPRWDGKGVIFNARAETAMGKPLFRNALRQNPAAIPTTGFFEWRQNPDHRKKEKFLFRLPDAPILYLAGFWKTFPDEAIADHFTILTTSANDAMLPFHSRMPVILLPEEIDAWLKGENRSDILARIPPPLRAIPAAREKPMND